MYTYIHVGIVTYKRHHAMLINDNMLMDITPCLQTLLLMLRRCVQYMYVHVCVCVLILVIGSVIRFLNGSYCFDEICCYLGKYQQIS